MNILVIKSTGNYETKIAELYKDEYIKKIRGNKTRIRREDVYRLYKNNN